MSHSTNPAAPRLAGEWLGRFHLLAAPLAADLAAWMPAYDAEYFRAWLRRAVERAEAESRHDVAELLAAAGVVPAVLAEPPVTVIHGEFYPPNIQHSHGQVYPIDWESAVISAPEIDLTALTSGWGEAERRAMVEGYLAGRGTGSELDPRRMAAASTYWASRWLAEYGTGDSWVIDELRQSVAGLDGDG
jgi:thiamine kinase-like enzyme